MIDPNTLRAIRAAAADPTHVASVFGRQLRRGLAFCPFHNEKVPSCSWQSKDGTTLAHCFSCGEGGDVFAITAAVYGLDSKRDFPEVVKTAAGLFGVAVEPGVHNLERFEKVNRSSHSADNAVSEPTVTRKPLSLADELATVLQPLDTSPEVSRYLAMRKLLAEASADGWWALDVTELRHLFDERIALEGDPMGSELALAGLIGKPEDKPARPYFTAHRLVIPWRTPSGDLDTIQRRAVAPTLAANVPRYVFPKGRQPLWPYGIEKDAGKGELVFVEGAFDTLARRKLDASAPTVLGIPGASNWQPRWASLAKGRTVRVSTDDNDAGNKVAQKIAADCWAAGAVRVIRERSEGGDWASQVAA